MKKFFYLVVLLLVGFSCMKEKDPELGFNFTTRQIVCYPKNNTFITFSIMPKGRNSPLSVKWNEPSDYQGEGPFKMALVSNFVLDFNIIDAENNFQKFTYPISMDTIDSLKYDYRNQYIGNYNCHVTYTYNGTVMNSSDTLTVEKNNDFAMLNVKYSHMIYNLSDSFFGYHSAATFRNDSIYFSESGPLGFYYTYLYKGIKITK
jgi:hypothetical protein